MNIIYSAERRAKYTYRDLRRLARDAGAGAGIGGSPMARRRREKTERRYFEAGNYWSSTENSDTNARNVNFSSCSPNNNNKTNTNYVRCVKGDGYAPLMP